jgi:hypothetical protein
VRRFIQTIPLRRPETAAANYTVAAEAGVGPLSVIAPLSANHLGVTDPLYNSARPDRRLRRADLGRMVLDPGKSKKATISSPDEKASTFTAGSKPAAAWLDPDLGSAMLIGSLAAV